MRAGRLVALLVGGQKRGHCAVDEVDVGLAALLRQVRAVAVEPIPPARAGAVPIDDAHVAVALRPPRERGVGVGHPVLRAARVDEEHLLVGSHGVDKLVHLLVGDCAVGAQREHHHVAHDALVGIGGVHVAPDGQLAVHGGVDGAVGEPFLEGGDGAHGNRVAYHDEVESGPLLGGRLPFGGRGRQPGGVGALVFEQIGALDGRGGRDEHKAAYRGEGHGRCRHGGDGVQVQPVGHVHLARAHAAHERADGAAADGIFHEAVRERGAREDDRELHRVHPPRCLADGALRAHEQKERVVPQVDAVGAQPYPHKRLGAGRPAKSAGRVHHDGNEDSGQNRGEQRSSVVPKRREAVRQHGHGHKPGESGRAHPVEHRALPLGQPHAAFRA